jgi:hypothetical protein
VHVIGCEVEHMVIWTPDALTVQKVARAEAFAGPINK